MRTLPRFLNRWLYAMAMAALLSALVVTAARADDSKADETKVSPPPETPAQLLAPPSQAKATDAELKMAKIAKEDGAKLSKAVLNLQYDLRDARERFARGERPTFGDLKGSAEDAYEALKNFKPTLEKVAGEIPTIDIKALAMFAMTLEVYYTYKSSLHVVAEMFPGSPYDAKKLSELELVLPTAIASKLVEVQGQQVAGEGGEVYDTAYQLKDAGAGKKRVSLHPRTLSRYRMMAFMTFPTKRTAEDALEFVALKSIFVKAAVLNSYLYTDEKANTALPEDADPLLRAMEAHASGFANEGAFRNYLRPAHFESVVRAYFAKRDNPLRLTKYVELLTKHLEAVAVVVGGKFEMERLAAHGTFEDLAKNHVILEKQPYRKDDKSPPEVYSQLALAFYKALKTMPGYFTEMSREELRLTFKRALKIAVANLMITTSESGIYNPEKISNPEAMAVGEVCGELAEAFIEDDMITDAELERFEKRRQTSINYTVSMRRYDLASRIIIAANYLDEIKKALQRVEKLQDGDDVPPDLIYRKPDPGMLLLALNYNTEKIPQWFIELLQGTGARTRNVKTAAERWQLKTQLDEVPEKLLKVASRAHDYATAPALSLLARVNNRQLAKAHYRWASTALRIAQLIELTPSIQVQKMLKNILAMMEFAKQMKSAALSAELEGAFEGLLKGSDKKLEELLIGMQKAQEFMGNSKVFMQMVFHPDDTTRYRFFRDQLRKKQVYINYTLVSIRELEGTMPILFSNMQLWSNGRHVTNNYDPISFGEFVTLLKTRAIPAKSLTTSLVQPALNNVSLSVYDDPEKFNAEVDLSSKVWGSDEGALGQTVTNPRAIAITAAMGRGTKRDLWTAIMDKVTDEVMDKGFFDLLTSKSSADRSKAIREAERNFRYPPMYDYYWQEKFKVRDVYPALLDSGASPQLRALRILVSTYLTPYLRSAIHASFDERNLLMKPGTDFTEAMLKSQTYRMLLDEVGDELGGGMSEMYREATKSRRFWEGVKKWGTKMQGVSHYVFYGTLIIPMPYDAHVAAGRYMGLATFIDLASDVMMFKDYWDSYSMLRPFQYSGALGGSLVNQSEVQKLRDDMYGLAHVLVNRIPMDAWFLGSMAIGEATQLKMAYGNYRAKAEMQRLGINRQVFDQDYGTLIMSYRIAGVRVGTGPKKWAEMFKGLKEKLEAKAKAGDHMATEELELYKNLDHQIESFGKKYPTLIKYYVGQGKSGFATEDDNNPHGDKAGDDTIFGIKDDEQK